MLIAQRALACSEACIGILGATASSVGRPSRSRRSSSDEQADVEARRWPLWVIAPRLTPRSGALHVARRHARPVDQSWPLGSTERCGCRSFCRARRKRQDGANPSIQLRAERERA
jgi:hypothetical protein